MSRLLKNGLASIIISILSFVAVAGATVCSQPALEGYDDAAQRAKKILPAETKDINHAVVYIEKDPRWRYYFHSNFIKPGNDHPTKIGNEEGFADTELAFYNIIFNTNNPSKAEMDSARKRFQEKDTFIFDKTVFDKEGKIELNFDFGTKE